MNRREAEEYLYCAMSIGEQLLVSGAEVGRVEDTIRRICLAYGAERADVFSITSSIVTTIYGTDFGVCTQTRRVSRMVKTPVTVFLVSATIPLIPGAALYRAMNCLMHRNYAGFSKEGTYTLLFAASMSAGITFTTVVFRMIWRQLYSSRSIHIR